jgi:hypothetical protein
MSDEVVRYIISCVLVEWHRDVGGYTMVRLAAGWATSWLIMVIASTASFDEIKKLVCFSNGLVGVYPVKLNDFACHPRRLVCLVFCTSSSLFQRWPRGEMFE